MLIVLAVHGSQMWLGHNLPLEMSSLNIWKSCEELYRGNAHITATSVDDELQYVPSSAQGIRSEDLFGPEEILTSCAGSSM